MTGAFAYFTPAPCFSGLDRMVFPEPCGVGDAPNDPLPSRVDEVDRRVKEILGVMAAAVCRDHPEIRARPGRASGCPLPLYSYYSFDLGVGVEMDAVIAGITVGRAGLGGRLKLRGEISGEESGRLDFECEEVETQDSDEALLRAASAMAREIAAQRNLVATTVLGRPQPPIY